MKTKGSTLMVVVDLLLCASLTVSAASFMTPAGIYGRFSGTVADTPVGSLLSTTTSITQNPDYALLKIDADFSNGTNYLHSHSGSSSRGVTSFARSLPVYSDGATGVVPDRVYTAHSVQNGTGDESYVRYLLTVFQ